MVYQRHAYGQGHHGPFSQELHAGEDGALPLRDPGNARRVEADGPVAATDTKGRRAEEVVGDHEHVLAVAWLQGDSRRSSLGYSIAAETGRGGLANLRHMWALALQDRVVFWFNTFIRSLVQDSTTQIVVLPAFFFC